MADPTAPEPASQRQDRSAIRTMRSDISEFLKTTKPSLISILVRQAEWEEAHDVKSEARRNTWFIILVAGAVIAAAAAAGIVGYRWLRPQAAPTPTGSAASGHIFYEDTLTINADRGRPALLGDLKAAGNAGAPSEEASFLRLVISSRGAAVNFAEFLKLAGSGSPSPTLAAPAQFFIYRRGERRAMGLIASPQSPAQTLQELERAEPSLQRNFEALFLGNLPPPVITPYEDRAYRNISFRYRPMDPGQERGLGYLYFPAERLIVIATSEEAIRAVVDRLFQQR